MEDKIFYSPENNSFYPLFLKSSYEESGSWPKDLVEVSTKDFQEFSLTTPEEKQRSYSKAKGLHWKTRNEVLSNEQLISNEVSWAKLEIDRVRDELEKIEDGYANSKISIENWKAYRKELREWADNPGKSTKRPSIKE